MSGQEPDFGPMEGRKQRWADSTRAGDAKPIRREDCAVALDFTPTTAAEQLASGYLKTTRPVGGYRPPDGSDPAHPDPHPQPAGRMSGNAGMDSDDYPQAARDQPSPI